MKKNTLILLIVIASLFIILVFFQFFQKQETKESTSSSLPVLQSSVQTKYQLPTFTGAWPNFPEKLPLLNLTITENSLIKEKLNDYCQTESFSGSFHLGKICAYYYYNNNQNLEIVTSIFPEIENLSKLTLETANQKAQTFLQNFLPDFSSLTQTNISYLAGEDEVFLTEPENAAFIQLSYNYTYQNIPLLEKNSQGDSFLVLLSQALPLQKAELLTQNLDFTPQNQLFALISLNQALKNISQGQAYLFGLGNFSMNTESAGLNISSLKNIQLNEVYLEYRYENDHLIGIPYYRFFGTGTDYNNNSFDLQIFTPAIQV